MEKTILPVIANSTDTGSLGVSLIGKQVFSGRPEDKTTVIKAFEDNTAAVRAEIPADRLLVYDLGAGWDPLCSFLGVDVPDVPYPFGNTTDEFNQQIAPKTQN